MLIFLILSILCSILLILISFRNYELRFKKDGNFQYIIYNKNHDKGTIFEDRKIIRIIKNIGYLSWFFVYPAITYFSIIEKRTIWPPYISAPIISWEFFFFLYNSQRRIAHLLYTSLHICLLSISLYYCNNILLYIYEFLFYFLLGFIVLFEARKTESFYYIKHLLINIYSAITIPLLFYYNDSTFSDNINIIIVATIQISNMLISCGYLMSEETPEPICYIFLSAFGLIMITLKYVLLITSILTKTNEFIEYIRKKL